MALGQVTKGVGSPALGLQPPSLWPPLAGYIEADLTPLPAMTRADMTGSFDRAYSSDGPTVASLFALNARHVAGGVASFTMERRRTPLEPLPARERGIWTVPLVSKWVYGATCSARGPIGP
jgi:hypothetical protein